MFFFFFLNRPDNVFTHLQKKCTKGFICSLPKVHLHTVSLGKGNHGGVNRVPLIYFFCIFVFVCMTFHNTQTPLFWGVSLCGHAWAS